MFIPPKSVTARLFSEQAKAVPDPAQSEPNAVPDPAPSEPNPDGGLARGPELRDEWPPRNDDMDSGRDRWQFGLRD
jgi:hypothetical protein